LPAGIKLGLDEGAERFWIKSLPAETIPVANIGFMPIMKQFHCQSI
jgi:hypothetical protein